jgi:hypothetical protein
LARHAQRGPIRYTRCRGCWRNGFEIYALFLTVGFALHQLVEASQYAQIPRYAGDVLATTVFGWATGGVIGGIVAD